jgi:hypothetical protein
LAPRIVIILANDWFKTVLSLRLFRFWSLSASGRRGRILGLKEWSRKTPLAGLALGERLTIGYAE